MMTMTLEVSTMEVRIVEVHQLVCLNFGTRSKNRSLLDKNCCMVANSRDPQKGLKELLRVFSLLHIISQIVYKIARALYDELISPNWLPLSLIQMERKWHDIQQDAIAVNIVRILLSFIRVRKIFKCICMILQPIHTKRFIGMRIRNILLEGLTPMVYQEVLI